LILASEMLGSTTGRGTDVESWKRALAAAVVIVAALVVAKIADRAISRRLDLPPEALTRYRMLRRTIVAAIVAIGVLSSLLVIPEIRAIAGGVLASSAVLGLVIGLAAQRTLANFVAGMLIAFAQPLRLGDNVEVLGTAGTVEEIRLTYTILRTPDGARFFIPNERLASDTIRNATIAGSEHLARVTVSVPLSSDLEAVLAMLVEVARVAPESVEDKEPVASVTELENDRALVSVEAWAATAADAGRLGSRIRLEAQRCLREQGTYA
jgi:small-conductance mechanosensitive channel